MPPAALMAVILLRADYPTSAPSVASVRAIRLSDRTLANAAVLLGKPACSVFVSGFLSDTL